MAVNRAVWVFEQAEVHVFAEDSAGAYGDKLLSYCFFTGVNLTSALPFTRKAVTGRGRKKIVPLSGVYENVSMEVNHLLFRAATELNSTDIFNADKQLRVILRMFNLTYSNVAPLENDRFELTFCRAPQFAVTGQELGFISATATFEAEKLLGSADIGRVPENLLT